ncbi:hypothetical protein GQ42DRAFT_165824 [Ramicandelaber brevisporus]|nr:hypothetical protein GQ42DRAFT_165824 [Ramicandelaber brevisporus]
MSHAGPAHQPTSVMVSVDPTTEYQPLLGEEPAEGIQYQQQPAAAAHACANCHCHSQSVQERVVELFPTSLQPMVNKTLTGTVSLFKYVFTILFVVVAAIFKRLHSFVKTRSFVALFSFFATLGVIVLVTFEVVLPCFWCRPDFHHLNAVWGNMAYPIRLTEAWSVLSEQPAHCLATDQSHAMPKHNLITNRRVYPMQRAHYNRKIYIPGLYIRAGGQMRSNIVVQEADDIDSVIVEYSVAHNGTSASFIQERTDLPRYSYNSPLIWLNAGDSTYYQWKSPYPGYPVAPSCAYANITITLPTDLAGGGRLFVAATRANIEIDDSAKSHFRAIRVVEPIEKQLSDFTVY